jgi:YXWGXW repeat-containing protein
MPRIVPAAALTSALVALSACVNVPPPQETHVIVQQPAQPATALIAPGPPPAPQAELVPPPPQGAGSVVWQPGHWMFTGMAGNPWSWQPGQYVPPPMGQTTWVPGHWAQQLSGGWVWMEGHWA